jgi:hypothetical protein
MTPHVHLHFFFNQNTFTENYCQKLILSKFFTYLY